MNDMPGAIQHGSILVPASAMDTITKAAKDGAIDAREAANRVWEKTGLFVSRFVYTTSYTLSYGVVFPAALIARSIHRDNAAVRGLMDGAKAATEKVRAMKSSV